MDTEVQEQKSVEDVKLDIDQEVQAVEDQAPNLAKFLERFPDAPTKETIEVWKQKHGDVFCSGFSEVELFIFRPLTRVEYLGVQKDVQARRQRGEEVLDNEFEENVVRTCILWATPFGQSALTKKGGTVSALHEQIMLNSNFLNSAMAASLVIKL